tara:strand:+ start:401 stop:625 length:225 start_codon:yes stop_codon:yes gene_type:complete
MRSNEVIVILQAIKAVVCELEGMRKQIEDCQNTLERMEQTGAGGGNITINLGGDEDSSESESGSGGDTPNSAPW